MKKTKMNVIEWTGVLFLVFMVVVLSFYSVGMILGFDTEKELMNYLKKPFLKIPGCIEVGAVNFSPIASVDDGTCRGEFSVTYVEPQKVSDVDGCTADSDHGYTDEDGREQIKLIKFILEKSVYYYRTGVWTIHHSHVCYFYTIDEDQYLDPSNREEIVKNCMLSTIPNIREEVMNPDDYILSSEVIVQPLVKINCEPEEEKQVEPEEEGNVSGCVYLGGARKYLVNPPSYLDCMVEDTFTISPERMLELVKKYGY